VIEDDRAEELGFPGPDARFKFDIGNEDRIADLLEKADEVLMGTEKKKEHFTRLSQTAYINKHVPEEKREQALQQMENNLRKTPVVSIHKKKDPAPEQPKETALHMSEKQSIEAAATGLKNAHDAVVNASKAAEEAAQTAMAKAADAVDPKSPVTEDEAEQASQAANEAAGAVGTAETNVVEAQNKLNKVVNESSQPELAAAAAEAIINPTPTTNDETDQPTEQPGSGLPESPDEQPAEEQPTAETAAPVSDGEPELPPVESPDAGQESSGDSGQEDIPVEEPVAEPPVEQPGASDANAENPQAEVPEVPGETAAPTLTDAPADGLESDEQVSEQPDANVDATDSAPDALGEDAPQDVPEPDGQGVVDLGMPEQTASDEAAAESTEESTQTTEENVTTEPGTDEPKDNNPQ
jgi:hypothetical protein